MRDGGENLLQVGSLELEGLERVLPLLDLQRCAYAVDEDTKMAWHTSKRIEGALQRLVFQTFLGQLIMAKVFKSVITPGIFNDNNFLYVLIFVQLQSNSVRLEPLHSVLLQPFQFQYRHFERAPVNPVLEATQLRERFSGWGLPVKLPARDAAASG
jgi:hypothetical protein